MTKVTIRARSVKPLSMISIESNSRSNSRSNSSIYRNLPLPVTFGLSVTLGSISVMTMTKSTMFVVPNLVLWTVDSCDVSMLISGATSTGNCTTSLAAGGSCIQEMANDTCTASRCDATRKIAAGTCVLKPSMRKCDAPGLRASPANPEFYRTTYNHQTPADNWQSLQKGGCLFNYQIRGWRQQQEFPGIVGKSVWDPWKRKQVNAWSLLPFHEPQTPNNTRTPKKDRDGKLWGDHVFEYAEKKKIDGQFLERLLPGKGCLDAPHKRDAKESNLKEFLKQHNLNDLDMRER